MIGIRSFVSSKMPSLVIRRYVIDIGNKKLIRLSSIMPYSSLMNYNSIVNIVQTRHYAMDKPKKHGNKKVEIREDILNEYFNVEKLKVEMSHVVENLQDQFHKHVTVRSAAGAIESLKFTFEGEEYSIQDLAQINRRNPKLVALDFSSFPQTIPSAMEALNNCGLNLNPQQDGLSVYVPIPKITREHREKLGKNAQAIFVKCKTAAKEVHIRYMKKLEMKSLAKPISYEQTKIVNENLNELTKIYISKMENMKNEKVKELLKDAIN